MSTEDVTSHPVAILCADGVEGAEVTVPRRALRDAGFDVRLISPDGAPVRGYHYIEPADEIEVDTALDSADPEDYSCLVLPGGLGGPDTLRKTDQAVSLVRRFWRLGRPVAVICHGPWMLIEAGVIEGRELTCAEQITTDVVNAGARYVDSDAHVEGTAAPLLVSGRNHDTVDDFAAALIGALRCVAEAAT